jgi:hypothetical protein
MVRQRCHVRLRGCAGIAWCALAEDDGVRAQVRIPTAYPSDLALWVVGIAGVVGSTLLLHAAFGFKGPAIVGALLAALWLASTLSWWWFNRSVSAACR